MYIYPFEREEQDKLTALSPPYQGIFRGIAMELEFRPNEIKFGMEEKRRELKRQVGNQVRLDISQMKTLYWQAFAVYLFK